MTDIISISGGISTNAVNLRAHAQGDGDRMAKSANGTLWVHSGSYGQFWGLTFDGSGFTGSNFALTNGQGENDLIGCQSLEAEDEAVASEGPLHILGGLYFTRNSNVDAPDIRIGRSDGASLYSTLIGLRTSHHQRGIEELNTGSTFRLGSQFGHLKIDQSPTPPLGLNGGHTVGCRITGNVICNVSSSVWTGNLVATGYDVTFGAGTTSHSFGPSNQVGPSDNINNLGNNASHICVNRGDGVLGLGGPVYCFGASGPSASGSGAELWIRVASNNGAPDPANGSISTPGYFEGAYQKGYRLRNSTGASFNAITCPSTSNISVGSNNGYLELAANSTGVILTVNGSQAMKIDSTRVSLDISLLVNAVNDAAASAAGGAVGELYRNGSVLIVRMV